jgi:DNA repair protein RadC
MLTIQLTTCNPSCDEKAIASKGLKHFEALKQLLAIHPEMRSYS